MSTEHITAAVRALTAAARDTYTDRDGGTHRYDFAELACQVLTTVAANLGGVEALLDTRPGSWEADHVRRIVYATAGDEREQLLRWRTEPVRLVLHVEDLFTDLGLDWLYQDAADVLAEREEQAADALFKGMATPEERARIEQIRAAVPRNAFWLNDETEQERAFALMAEARTITAGVTQRAEQAGAPLAAALATAVRLNAALDQLWQQDQVTYHQAYIDTARQVAIERGITAPVEVRLITDDRPQPDQDQGDLLAEEVADEARLRTPLPTSGIPLRDYQGLPGEVDRAAGRSYLARLAAQDDTATGSDGAR
jgi:hypothetical protein